MRSLHDEQLPDKIAELLRSARTPAQSARARDHREHADDRSAAHARHPGAPASDGHQIAIDDFGTGIRRWPT